VIKRIIVLSIGLVLIGAVVISDPEPIIIEIDGEQVYVITVEKTQIMCEFCTAPVDKHKFCIEQWGWGRQGGGDGPYVWENKGTICMSKQWESSWGFNEVPTLNISGFHEVNIEAGWVNIDSEFGTIIDGEEAHTIFIPTICK
jgi:hypothetical protein